ncbi:MAG: neutral/alkaline non-lysosomal ceramidase N-terminal domain-containing protein [Gammaproteobacteria bacterium]|nr:neutral/alkaline non-lysosomal ceramidase N-terminal domain-containing protein [Gammaproteobacteria bacterium]
MLFIAFIGPWPLADLPYAGSTYAASSYARITAWSPPHKTGALSAGYSQVDITPPVGVPLAGYSAREPKDNVGHLAPLYAKALTFNNGHNTVTFLSADYLLPLPQLVDAICARAQIARDELYVGSTHTHSGPGGYAHGVIARGALGNFDSVQFERMVNAFAGIVIQSRHELHPIELHIDQYQMSPALTRLFIMNHMNDTPGHSTLNLARIFHIDGDRKKPLSAFFTFSAHPTFFGRLNRFAHGDYPGVVQGALTTQLGYPVMFMAGAVGGNYAMGLGRPPSAVPGEQLAQIDDFSSRFVAMMRDLARDNIPADVTRVMHEEVRQAEIISHTTLVDLPPTSYRVLGDWVLSSWLVEHLFHGDQTDLQMTRIGPWILWGFPADFSSELATTLETYAQAQGSLGWVTSFSGDYIGYIMPHHYYAQDTYESRRANIYGPWAGEYFVELATRLALHSQPQATPFPGPR